MFYAYAAMAGLKLLGGFQQADVIRQNGDLQSRVNNMNAQFAEVDAHNAMVAGYTNAARYQNVVDKANADTRGGYASEGVSIGYGTAGEAEKDNHIAGMMNVLQMQRAARDAAMGYQSQAINMRLGAQNIQLQAGLNASSAQTQGIYGAVSELGQGAFQDAMAGKGRDSTTGSDATPGTQGKSITMNLNKNGDGIAAPIGGMGWERPLGWYPDPAKAYDNGQPGFFGHGPGPSWQNTGNGNYSFTGETGG